MTHPSALSLPRLTPSVSSASLSGCAISASILDFEASEWNTLISKDEPQLRHDFLLAAEKSGMAINPRYVSVRRQGRLAGVAILADADIDLFTLAAPGLKRLAERVRRGPLKRFLILRAQTCGPVITNCRPNMALAPWLSENEHAEVARELVEALDAIGPASLRVFFEMDETVSAQFGPAFKHSAYIKAASLPGTRLPIEWGSFEEYVGAMRKFYRRAVRDDQAKATGLTIEIEENFAHLADEVSALYLQVLERAQNNFETLTPDFFREFSACEGSRLVTARLKETGQLVGVELLFVGETMVQDLYTGVDYRFNEEFNVYFNLVYPAIQLACERGFRFVSTGQTSYKFKSRLGIEPFRLSIFIKHRNPIVNAILRRIHPLICPETPTVEHRVFKSEAHHINTPPKPKREVTTV